MELLLVIVIISILASLGVGVMAQAQNDAAIAATRSRISIIEKILEVELENYEVRRSPVSFGVLSAMVASSGELESGRLLLHVKTLKRMIMADLIRAEMPDGSVTGGRNIGEFPTPALQTFFADQLSINVNRIDPLTGRPLFPGVHQSNRPASVVEWDSWATRYLGGTAPTATNWPPIKDSRLEDLTVEDPIIEDAAFKSELLYEILQKINIDGVPATEALGSQSIADTNGNGFNEIVDAWGEPLFLQWQQVLMTGEPGESVWSESEQAPGIDMCGLTCEHFFPQTGIAITDYVRPVLPTQIRPFLTSERLLKIDRYPADFFQRVLP
jgi:hypothetical protein